MKNSIWGRRSGSDGDVSGENAMNEKQFHLPCYRKMLWWSIR
jgi:hypothetical protein